MRLPIAASILALVSGCAGVAKQGPMPALDPPPICYTETQCEAMWSEAIVQASLVGGMRIQTATESFLQTYKATDYDRLGAQVRKMPRPGGGTAIESRFECYYPCGDLAYKAVNLFTAKVKAAGEAFGPTGDNPAPPIPTQTNPAASSQASKAQQLEDLKRQNLPYEEYQKRYRQITGE